MAAEIIYYAPMEGLTDSIYRRMHHRYFPGVDGYFMPFFSPTEHRCLTNREARELPMANEEAFFAVPQVMTKSPSDFLWACQVCADRGYTQINLNAGCPSGTVVSKGKGAGLLNHTENLRQILDVVCAQSPIPVSVKTRLGLLGDDEYPALQALYNDYPLALLIIHPRVRKQFYNGTADRSWFAYACENSKNHICLNGDLTTAGTCEQTAAEFPKAHSLMLGRGLIANPGMFTPGGTTNEKLAAFYAELLDAYITAFGGSMNAMFRLKEHWNYLLPHFQGGEKLGKQLRKTTSLPEFRRLTQEICGSCLYVQNPSK